MYTCGTSFELPFIPPGSYDGLRPLFRFHTLIIKMQYDYSSWCSVSPVYVITPYTDLDNGP